MELYFTLPYMPSWRVMAIKHSIVFLFISNSSSPKNVSVVLVLNQAPWHVNALGSGGTPPCILNLDS